MALKKPRKPKYGKKPKATASVETINNYIKRCDEKDKTFNERMSDYEKNKKAKADARKKLTTFKPGRKIKKK